MAGVVQILLIIAYPIHFIFCFTALYKLIYADIKPSDKWMWLIFIFVVPLCGGLILMYDLEKGKTYNKNKNKE